MFSFSDALFTFSFLVTIVKSAPRPAPQSFEHDASWLSMPLDNLPYEDEWVNYALPADLFDWNPTPDPNLSWNEGDLFATDVGSGEFCSAEDLELSPLIGRLRAREGSEYGSGAGKTCAAPTEGDNDEELTPFLLQLPELEEVIFPPVKSEREICPISKYGKRDIPLCSSGDPNDVIFDRETISIILVNAKLYNPFYGCLQPEELYCCYTVSTGEPGFVEAERTGWNIVGGDCLKVLRPSA